MSQFRGIVKQKRMLINVVLSKNEHIVNGKVFKAVIDTGATTTVVKQSIADKLKLIPSKKHCINTASGYLLATQCDIYIFIIGDGIRTTTPNNTKYNMTILSGLYEEYKYDVLLGMDIISQCKRFLIEKNNYILET